MSGLIPHKFVVSLGYSFSLIFMKGLCFCDSKVIGILYFLISVFGGLLGFSLSLVMRLELSLPFCFFLEDFYFIYLTSHGLVMLFFFITVLSSVFLNFFFPGFCLLEDMFLRKTNVFGFYLIVISLGFLILSLLIGGGVDCGWTLYVPLTSSRFFYSYSLEIAVVAIQIFSFGSLSTSLNILVTLLLNFKRLESFFDFSPFYISYFFMAVLIIVALPALSIVLSMLLLDRNFGTFFFNYEFGGDPVLFQTMFWVFGHPEVYILILPVFGVVSLVVESSCIGSGVFNKIGVIFSMFSLFVLSFMVFGHHMVTVGYSLDFRGFFMTTTIVISIPTGIKIFSWMFNLFMCGVRFNFSFGFLIVFLFFFSFGGLSGVFLSNISLDLVFHDTYFVVGHFHIVLGAASIFGFLSGSFYLFKSIFCLSFIYRLRSCFFLSFVYFILVLFLPFHFIGLLGFPRRISSYCFTFFPLIYLVSVGVFGLLVLIFLFFYFFLLLFVRR